MNKIVYFGVIVVSVVIAYGENVFGGPMNIEKDLKVTDSIYEGIRVNKSCKIIFDNAQDIVVGDMYNSKTPGIEIAPRVTLTVQLNGYGNVNIYGGCSVGFGNRYSYAAIYVPVGAVLVIEGNNTCILNAVGHLGAAGIGGCGVSMNVRDVDYSMINAGSIYIKSGNVTTSSSCHDKCLHRGTGAGIGGGGLFNAIDRENLIGGSVDLIEIYDGNVTAIGGGCSDCAGVGAGIGGGGVCNVANEIAYIKGGDLKKVKLNKGVVTARGGCNNNAQGVGAGIGGGGIYNKGKCDRMQEGCLREFFSNGDVRLNVVGGYRNSVDIGSGSIQYIATCIDGVPPITSFKAEVLGVEDALYDSKGKIFSSVIMTIIGFLVMLGK